MLAIPVIAIFDVGKTNKKFFLFNGEYRIVYEETVQFAETTDEDGFPCEDLAFLSEWITDTFRKVSALPAYDIRSVNFSAYGASFVHLDNDGSCVAPLYNYLKPYPEDLEEQFYNQYGGKELVSIETSSPVLGNLNSGMLLYWLKYRRPEVFKSIRCSLHLPQYLSYLITGRKYSDITSIGCHTALWHFGNNNYHHWVSGEGIDEKLAPVCKSNQPINVNLNGKQLQAGTGLHDSSAALIPYLTSFTEPFILISTGTWCISLNPFNSSELTQQELQQDCLSYMTYEGKPVKASRLFAGNDHEQQVKKIAAHFNLGPDFYKGIQYVSIMLERLTRVELPVSGPYVGGTVPSFFGNRDLSVFTSCEEAYHVLIADIIKQQVASVKLVLQNSPVKKIFVDGGFSKNPIYMSLLAQAFAGTDVYAASVAQATALGAALAIHTSWNEKKLPENLVELKFYSANGSGK